MARKLYDSEVTVNGVKLHVVQAGPRSGKPVLLLHGWPEFWYGWRHQIEHLADLGYRVTAPDQRGYNTSDKPSAVTAYSLNILQEDVLALINHLGHRRIHLVGHDWGGSVAWYFASNYPERLRSLTIMNAPHHAEFLKSVGGNPRQALRVWHLLAFQLPVLPEQLLKRSNYQSLTRRLRKSMLAGSLTDADAVKYLEAWSQPGAMKASLKWYKAMLRSPPAKTRHRKIKIPTQIIWGNNDNILPPNIAQDALRQCPLGELKVVRDAGHFPHADQPAIVNQHLERFLASF